MNCPHCDGPVLRVTGREVYPHRPDLHHLPFYECFVCLARVGCHPGTTTPLGTVATKEQRKWRAKVHEKLDVHWKNKVGYRFRRQARTMCYKRLSDDMGICAEETHVGMFTVQQCMKALKILSNWKL